MPRLVGGAARAGRALLDLFYPPRCPGCGRMGAALCDRCLAQIERIGPAVCRRCGCTLPREGLCSRCRAHPSSLDGIVAVALFAEPLRQAIHALKYENNAALAAPLAALMVDRWRGGGLPGADLIVPVPLHGRRQAERGYNQAGLLAHAVARGVGVPVDEHALVRLRATPPQVGLSLAERRQNVEGAFACRADLEDKVVIVVDDVCTTGATLEACADALRAAGARAVWAFTLARAPWGPAEDNATFVVDMRGD